MQWQILHFLAVIVISSFGGIVLVVLDRKIEVKTIKDFTQSICVSVFSGVLLYLFIYTLNFDQSVKIGCAGIASFASVDILIAMKKILLDNLGKFFKVSKAEKREE